MTITGLDPTFAPPVRRGVLRETAERLVNDPRDLPFLSLMAWLAVTVVASGVVLFVPGMFRWWIGALHLALVLYYLGPFILMLHNTSHRRLFRRSFRWLNVIIPWVLGPFFGESPETYFAHHVGMHHAEGNLPNDLSSTLRYRRDHLGHFLRYLGRFFFVGLFELARYFATRRRYRLLARCLVGEAAFFLCMGVLAFVDWRATLVVFVLPFVIARCAMMAGNWGQHAFVDPAAPECSYRNSITCVNSPYNRRCFNDGYHIGHHVKPTRHWTEMPSDFAANIATYAEKEAIVFERLDFFAIWVLLMLRRYDRLAERVVHLGGPRRSHAETVALLRRRVEWTI